jgi:hypothetical protein
MLSFMKLNHFNVKYHFLDVESCQFNSIWTFLLNLEEITLNLFSRFNLVVNVQVDSRQTEVKSIKHTKRLINIF